MYVLVGLTTVDKLEVLWHWSIVRSIRVTEPTWFVMQCNVSSSSPIITHIAIQTCVWIGVRWLAGIKHSELGDAIFQRREHVTLKEWVRREFFECGFQEPTRRLRVWLGLRVGYDFPLGRVTRALYLAAYSFETNNNVRINVGSCIRAKLSSP